MRQLPSNLLKMGRNVAAAYGDAAGRAVSRYFQAEERAESVSSPGPSAFDLYKREHFNLLHGMYVN